MRLKSTLNRRFGLVCLTMYKDAIHPYEDYMILRSRISTEPEENDLFAGIRDQIVSVEDEGS